MDGIGYADQRTQYCGNYKGGFGVGLCRAPTQQKNLKCQKNAEFAIDDGRENRNGGAKWPAMERHRMAVDGLGRTQRPGNGGQQENAKRGRSANTATACIACMKTHESGQGDKGAPGHTARAWHGFMQLHD